MTTNKVPQIRFDGFSGKWEEKKLGDITEIIGGGTPSTNIPEYWNGEIDWYSPTEIGNNIYARGSVKKITLLGLEKSSARVLPADKTILFTSRAGIGSVAILKKDGATNQGFQSLIIKDTHHIYFIYSINNKIKKYALKIASGSTFLEISGKQLAKIYIQIPKKDEQTKIGNYFQNLDKLIEQKEKKHKKLGQLKKAMLEKMFPKDGKDTPAIRFKGFSGEWEEKKLDEIGNATSGTSIESEFLDRGKYKVVSIGSYSEQSTYTDQGIRTNLSKKTQKRILNKNDLTMVLNDKTASGNILGRVLLIKDNDTFVYNQRTQRIEPYQDKYNSQFLYQLLNAPLVRNKIINKSQGNTQIYVNWSGIKELYYLLPEKTEQIKIANYFQHFDKLIEQQHKELEKLKNIKKASLDKMFV